MHSVPSTLPIDPATQPMGHSKLEGSDPRTLANLLKQDSAQAYEAKEEPLINPES